MLMISVGCFFLGLLLGGIVCWFVQERRIKLVHDQLDQFRLSEVKLQAQLDVATKDVASQQAQNQTMQDTFKAIASDVIRTSSEGIYKQAEERFKRIQEASGKDLDSRKQLIDHSIKTMNEKLDAITAQSTQLKSSLDHCNTTTQNLHQTTRHLRDILSSSQRRGQWGERIVEDILQYIGLIEQVNYVKQQQVTSGEKPDFTFLLPQNKVLNMDVKFPLDHYEAFLSTDDVHAKEQEKNAFLKAIKSHIKCVSGRAYINPSEGTLNYVMLFIPNESIYGFIHTEDAQLVDFALSQRVLLCSPLTLYSILSLVHQASQAFTMNERASDVMLLLNQFNQQWKKYSERHEALGKQLETVNRTYTDLTQTRTRALQKPLDKIELLSSDMKSPELISE